MQSFDITPHYYLICYFPQHRTLLALKKKNTPLHASIS